MATVCCRIVLPCLSKTVPHTCQSGRPLGSSCGAMQTSDTAGPRSLPKLETDIQAQFDQQDQQERRKAVKQGEIVADGVSSGGLMQTKRSVTVVRDVDHCLPQYSVLSFVLCFCSLMSLKLLISWVMSLLFGALGSCACLSFVFVVHSFFRACIAYTVCAAERDCWARVASRNLFGAIDSCVGFLDLGEQRVLLDVGTCRARLLHTITVLLHTQTCQQGRSARHQRLRCVEPTLRLNKYTITVVTSPFQCRVRTLCGLVSSGIGCDIPTTFYGKECTYDKARS